MMSDRWDGIVPVGGAHLQINESYPGVVRVHDAPPVFLCDGFLSTEEVPRAREEDTPPPRLRFSAVL